MNMDGILNVNKPPGQTSFSVVAFVRRLSGERKVGHGGTLDPEASGVLPICLGRATKVARFLTQGNKVYQTQIELGTATDTYDASGKVTWQGDYSTATQQRVETTLASFSGTIEQTPPMYSALKHRGQPLYRLARAGIELPRPRRTVQIFHIELLDFALPLLTVEITCSKGTYIRSLAHDLGLALGCGAHIKSLLRLQSGPFHLSEAVTLPQIEDAFRDHYWPELLYPLDTVLLRSMAIIIDQEKEQALMKGQLLQLPEGRDGEHYRAYSVDGRLLALLRFDQGLWKSENLLTTT